MIRRLLLAACVLGASASGAAATSLTPRLPLTLFGDESVASTDDARAMAFNPAATGRRYPSELLAGFARRDGHHEWNSTLFTSGRLGLYALRQRDTSQTYGASFAFGNEKLSVGLSPYWLISGRPVRERTDDQRIGVLSRPAPWLSAGFTIDHLFQPKFRSERRARTYTLGLGWRPLALLRTQAHALGTRLTLTGDVTIVDDGEWRQARTQVGGEFEPLPGLALNATLADHRNLRIGVTLRGVHLTAHAGSASQGDAQLYENYALGYHGGEEPTSFASPGARRVAIVRAGGALADESMGGVSLLGAGSSVAAAPLHRQFQRALEDPLTRGVFLDLRGVEGMAQIEELRPRIQKLRAAGKPVVAYMEYGGGRGDLFLASACDRALATEDASFAALGLRTERRYYRQMLADLGVRVDRSSIGAYKSAYRNLSVDATPPADTLAIQHSLTQLQELFTRAVTTDRRIPPARLAPILDGRAWPAGDLVRAGLLDSVGYREQAMRELGRLTRLGDKPRAVNLARRPAARRAWALPTRIAVVYAGGGIETGRSGSDLLTGPFMGSETLIKELERAFHEPGVKAVVLRVDSPGGSALASNLIDHAVQRLRRETHRPLIVSMAGSAASGGYYISCHADWIVADRFTRTGSIGVLFLKPSLEGFYARHHVREDDFERGSAMAGWSAARDWTPAMQASADSAIAREYRSFVDKVADGRHLTPDEVNTQAQGRVWLGEDAKQRRLVDAIGGLDDALAEARRRGGVPAGEKIRLLELGRPRGSFFERLIGNWLRASMDRDAHLPDFTQAQARALDEADAPDE